ncbi:putative pentatricopeptide repeat-containing protein At3g05240 [Magnolia sinica]|uniref:putative pentatricopeptide repeat-containing protein At3g05240 n=1 Tax=Magnolia sinica TaxID=86752 RepID=UPI002658C552|nr:putative pentatricopeptide repeat-containing protein At3g05240 [Magnolia sinica]
MFPPPKHIPLASRVKSNLFLLLSLHTASPAKTNQNPEFKFPTHPNLHSLLAKCTFIKELKQIHAHIIQIGYLKEIVTAGKLIAFCATSHMGDLCHAQLVFDQIAEPNRFLWNSLIRGYSNSSNPRESIFLYSRMMGAGFTPDEFTFPFVLKACSLESAFMEAIGIHVHVVKLRFGSQVSVQNVLLHVYAVCGLIQYARQLFDDLSGEVLFLGIQ